MYHAAVPELWYDRIDEHLDGLGWIERSSQLLAGLEQKC
jgi:hypothetical protein